MSDAELSLCRILAADNFQFLELICHGPLTGSDAATASKGILKLLMTYGTAATESFICKLLHKRVLQYSNKN
jgi:hypothetical protein